MFFTRKFFLIYSLIIIYFCCFFTSCATSINVTVTRPGKLDLNGAQSIAVLPFVSGDDNFFYSQNSGGTIIIGDFFNNYVQENVIESRILNYLHSEIERGLIKSPYISLISSSVVKNALRFGKVPPADVYLTGEMVTFNIIDQEHVEKVELDPELIEKDSKKNDDKKTYYYKSTFVRKILAIFNYQIVDSSTSKVISFDTVKFEKSSGIFDRKDNLPDPFMMIEFDLDNFISCLLRNIQPYTVTKSIVLLKDKSKNPNMEIADRFARDGYLKESFAEFSKIYTDTRLMEAGYNGAMILLALGQYENAESLMIDVYNRYRNPQVLEGLYDIRNEKYQSELLLEQTKHIDN